jgi:hypothetical protein
MYYRPVVQAVSFGLVTRSPTAKQRSAGAKKKKKKKKKKKEKKENRVSGRNRFAGTETCAEKKERDEMELRVPELSNDTPLW